MPDEHEALLLALLNSTPVVDGRPTDELGDDESAGRWLNAHWPGRTVEDWQWVRRGRALLQDVVRGDQPPTALGVLLEEVVSRPSVTEAGLVWTLAADPAHVMVGAPTTDD